MAPSAPDSPPPRHASRPLASQVVQVLVWIAFGVGLFACIAVLLPPSVAALRDVQEVELEAAAEAELNDPEEQLHAAHEGEELLAPSTATELARKEEAERLVQPSHS